MGERILAVGFVFVCITFFLFPSSGEMEGHILWWLFREGLGSAGGLAISRSNSDSDTNCAVLCPHRDHNHGCP